jgi:TPR repeat protein
LPLIEGAGYDPTIEDKRFEVIESDGKEAVSMYSALMSEHSRDPYATKQCAAAQMMLGRAYIEGLGVKYDPMVGYRKIYRAAIDYESADAARFLLENAETARSYKINVDRIELLAGCKYFREVSGNLGTPKSHRVPLLIPAEDTDSLKT